MTELTKILEKLDRIERLLVEQKYEGLTEKSVELWKIEDIAAYTKFTTRQVQSMILAPYFPSPVRVPSQRDPNQASNKRRWFAGEVVRYMRHRQNLR